METRESVKINLNSKALSNIAQYYLLWDKLLPFDQFSQTIPLGIKRVYVMRVYIKREVMQFELNEIRYIDSLSDIPYHIFLISSLFHIYNTVTS